MNPLVVAIFINTIALACCGPYFLLRGPTAQSTITGQDGTKLETQAIAGSITSKGVIGPTFKAITIVENSRGATGGNGAYGQYSNDCGSACGGDSAYLQGDATKYDKAIVAGPADSTDSHSQSVHATIYGQDGSKIVSDMEPGSISDNAIIGPTFDASAEIYNSYAVEGASGLTPHNCGGNCGTAGASNSSPYPGQTTTYIQDGNKIRSQADSGSVSSQGITGPTFEASTSVENTKGSDSGKFSYNCGSACGVGNGHLSSDNTKYTPTIAAGQTDTSNLHSNFGQPTIHGQGGSKIVSEATSGSILNGRLIGPTFTASTTVQDAQHTAGNEVHGQSPYNCEGGPCGIGSTTTNAEGITSGSNPNHQSNHTTTYGHDGSKIVSQTSNSHLNFGQSTIHGQDGSKMVSEANSGSILNGRLVGPTFTASTTVQGAQHTAGNEVHGQSPYNCDGGPCGIGSTTTNTEGITSVSNPNHTTIYGHDGNKIVSQTHGGSLSSAGIVGPTFTASTTVQDTQHVVGNGAHRPSSYNCGGGSCGFGSTHLSHEGTNGNPTIAAGTATLNGNHDSEHATVYGHGGSKIVSQVHGGSISSERVVGPTFGASTSAENALVGGENGPGQSPKLSNEGTKYNPIIAEGQVDTLNSHPYHQYSVIHEHGGSKIVSEASAGSILSKGIVGPTFKAYTTTNNAQLTGGKSAFGQSRHNLSNQYIQYDSTIPQESVQTSNLNPYSSGSSVLSQEPSVTSSITGSTSTGEVAGSGSSKYGNNEFPHSSQEQNNAGNSQASIKCDGNICGSTPGNSVHQSSQKFEYSEVLHGNSQHPIGLGVSAGSADHAFDTSKGVQDSNSHSITPGNLVYESSQKFEYNGASHGIAQHPNGLGVQGPPLASSIKQSTLDHHNENSQDEGYSVPNPSPVYGQDQNAGAYDSSSIESATHTHPNEQFIGHGYYHTSSYAHPSNVFVQDAGSSGHLAGQTKEYLPPSNNYGGGANSGVQHGSGSSNYNFGSGQDYSESSSFAPATYRRPDNVGANAQGTAVSSFENTMQSGGIPSYNCYVIKFPINTYSSNIPTDLSLFLKKLVRSSSIKPDVYYIHKHYNRHYNDY